MTQIMVVDDDKNLRMVIRAILEQENYDIVEAESGIKCIEKLEKGSRPDLILLDVMMPRMNGWETCEKIKGEKDLKDIPIVMLTVKSEDADKIKSLGDSGADWHIAKPIDKNDFVKTIKWVLS